MIKYIASICFLLTFIQGALAQSPMSDYDFIVVPEQFEFQNERDQYQLNSIAEFLFNKHGFNAYLNHETPNANRCNGLFADVIKESILLRKKLVLVIKDCNGFELYRHEGVSKFKEYRKAYQDALRKAFEEIELLNVEQSDVVLLSNSPQADVSSSAETKKSEEIKIARTSDLEKEMGQKAITEVPKVAESIPTNPKNTWVSETEVILNVPVEKFSNYSRNGASFLLRKTAEGYSLYEESTASAEGLNLIGNIEVSEENQVYFIDTSDQLFKASFTTSEDLVIQKGNISEVYKKVN